MDRANSDRNVLIVGETIDGRLSAGTKDLARQARTLARWFDGKPIGVLTGHAGEPAARQWSATNRIPVIYLDHARCRHPNPCMAASAVEKLARKFSPTAVCFPNSMRACQTAAMLAWRLKAPCITAVESIFKAGDDFRFKRSVLGGRLCQTVTTNARPILLTVSPGIFSTSPPPCLPDRSSCVEVRHLTDEDRRFTPLAIQRRSDNGQDLPNAQVIVAGGRGLGGPEDVVLLHMVAGIFKNASIGSSRGACDLGWLPHSRQIGETGRTVSPALYLACGISGAPQHLAGMRSSQIIVGVNTDPNAAIFNVAHYAVVEDLRTFLPLLRQRYDRKNNQGETE